MAAPTFVAASAGFTDAGGAWSFNSGSVTGVLAGDIVICQILQDGATSGAVARNSTGGVNTLAGAGGWTTLATEQPVGSATAGFQFFYIGRTQADLGAVVAGGTNSTSEDLYCRFYYFRDVSTGTTLATVIENGTAGTVVNGAATSATCADTAVTTLGVDRLAVNLGAITDDATGIAVFTGQSGGTWANFQLYEEASGTDGSLFYEDAAMASAGTIDGGSDTITSLPWGVLGFALIGTTVPSAFIEIKDPWPALQAVKRASTW